MNVMTPQNNLFVISNYIKFNNFEKFLEEKGREIFREIYFNYDRFTRHYLLNLEGNRFTIIFHKARKNNCYFCNIINHEDEGKLNTLFFMKLILDWIPTSNKDQFAACRSQNQCYYC